MKISIVTPVYNEEKNIERFFKAIEKIDYPKENFELIFVNDASSDNSQKILEKIKEESNLNIRLIKLKNNSGRAVVRLTGAKNTKYSNILFIDCKCEICPGTLKAIKKAKHPAINCYIRQKNNHIFDRFLYLIRQKFHKIAPKKLFKIKYITKENFDQVPKGTTAFFCEKNLFIKSQFKNIHDKDCSDDTKLLRNIVNKTPILFIKEASAYYNTRPEFIENCKHIFNRGPKFIDYYYKPSKIQFWIINFAFLFIIFTIYLINTTHYFLELIILILIINSIIALYLTKKFKDFFISFLLFPIFSSLFLLGAIKGIFKKIIKLIKNES